MKIRSYLRRSESVSACLQEYGDALQMAATWRDNARTLASNFRQDHVVNWLIHLAHGPGFIIHISCDIWASVYWLMLLVYTPALSGSAMASF